MTIRGDEPISRDALIRQAGNADDDAARLEILCQLQALPYQDEQWTEELNRLSGLVDQWINGPELFQWFDRPIRKTLDYDFGIDRSSPLYPLTHLYRARMLIWTALAHRTAAPTATALPPAAGEASGRT